MYGENPKKSPGTPRPTIGWWKSEYDENARLGMTDEEVDKARADSLLDTVRGLENVQQEVHQQNLWSAQLYSNRELAAFDWGNNSLYHASLQPVSRTGENLVLMVVDTLVSQVGKNRPKARPQTRGASWNLRQQAKRLDKFLYGEFIRNRVYEKGKRVFKDACIFGFGSLYVCMDGGRLSIERVFPDELIVDQMEVVAAGKPRHVYRRRVLPVEVVKASWGEGQGEDLVDELDAIARHTDYLDYRAVGLGYVVVVEGWQLATPTQPGRYVCAVPGRMLADKEYALEVAPFVNFHWQEALSGFYAASVVEQTLSYQIRLNEINDVIRDAQDIMGRPRLLVAEGSRVNPLEIDNVVARMIKYTGIKPEAVTWPAVSAELYNERDRQVRICLEQFGISAMAAKVAPPAAARFDSSAAFREFNAIQDDRLSDPAQRFERFYLDLAEVMIKVLRASGENPKTTWMSGGKHGGMEVIDWAEIDLEDHAYVLQLEATSVFDSTPSAIRDDLEKQLAMGTITPEEYRLQLSHPDDQAELSLQSAAAADIRRVIDLLEGGEYESPTPMQDLVSGVQMVTLAALNLKQYEDVDPEIHLNFLNWVTAARNLLSIGEEPPSPVETADVMPGLGQPGMPPPPGQPAMPGMGAGFPGAPGPAAVPVPEAAGMIPQG